MDVRLEDATTMLAQTPVKLSSLLAWHDEIWLVSDTGADTFSPRDVLGHLIDGERTDWVPRAKSILAADERPFEPFDRFAMLEVSDSLILASTEGFYPITKVIYALSTGPADGEKLASAMGMLAMVLLVTSLVVAGRVLGERMGELFRA